VNWWWLLALPAYPIFGYFLSAVFSRGEYAYHLRHGSKNYDAERERRENTTVLTWMWPLAAPVFFFVGGCFLLGEMHNPLAGVHRWIATPAVIRKEQKAAPR
jgi:hypothetical protein